MTITAAQLDQLSIEGDRPADAVIEQHAAQHPDVTPRHLVAAIGRHPGAGTAPQPSVIDAYLAEEPPLPSWRDPAQLARAAAFFELQGIEIGSTLFCASLPEAYAGARGARVLTLTAQLVTDPVRRVYETAQMIIDAMSPDGLDVGTDGYRAIRRVRLMHAAVRYLILHGPGVERTRDAALAYGKGPRPPRRWYVPGGTPLNQEDLLGTLLSFTTAVFDALELQGVGCDRADAEAYLHRWCVVGELLGIRSDLLPLGLDEARALEALIRGRQQRPSLDAPYLAAALVGALQRSIRLPGMRSLPASLIRYYCGDTVAGINGIRRGGWTALLLGPLRRAFHLFNRVEQHHRLVANLTRHLTASFLHGFEAQDRGGRPPFQIPDRLHEQVRHAERRWRL